MTDPLAVARAWIGTPYRLHGALRGVGADCIGLVRGVYGEMHDCAPPGVPRYVADWHLDFDAEPLIAAAREHLDEIAIDDARPGDVLVFRVMPLRAAQHCGVLSALDPAAMIHATERARGVVETSVGSWWERRVAAFRF